MSTLLERLGLDPAAVRAAAGASYQQACERRVTEVLSGKAAPIFTERCKVSQRKTKTHYLDGEEQRAKKALLAANHLEILQMYLRGESVRVIATIYGVTDMCIYNRVSPLLRVMAETRRQMEATVQADRAAADRHQLAGSLSPSQVAASSSVIRPVSEQANMDRTASTATS